MPQLLLAMAAGAGLYGLYKWVARDAGPDGAASGRQTRGPKDLGDLIYDETTGTYRPKS